MTDRHEPYELLPADGLGLSDDAVAVYRACFRQGDGNMCSDSNYNIWMDVYLDNARSGFPCSGKRLSGLFSALEAKGLYRPIDKFWGEIRVRDVET